MDETRSRIMAAIGSKDTRPEIALRRSLHAVGLRFRLHAKELPGRPDIVFRPARTAIFVHGCFWHRHDGCRRAGMPKTNPDFWREKFEANVARDSRTSERLIEMGWMVLVVWECGLVGLPRIGAASDEIRGILSERSAGGRLRGGARTIRC